MPTRMGRKTKRKIFARTSFNGLHDYPETAEKKSRLSCKSFNTWTVDEVYQYFMEEGLEYEATKFREEEITGNLLHLLTEQRLEKMGLSTLGQRLKILHLLENLKESCHLPVPPYVQKNEVKVFNDPIHGHIELHPLCIRIIDTPQFQRLRYIKQLGGCYFVFPGASHNRFEHSLGVAHLAGRLVREIRSRQPELNITDQDILCVELAGLCHDLGHGPYSHMFDGKFIPQILPQSKWRHEDASVKMFDYLVQDNDLVAEFEQHQLCEQDRTFIKEQIAGPLERDNKHLENWPYKGRTSSKSFLYEVVANKRNGIDVDKWDYFARDCHHLGITNNFDHSRFIKFARVLEVEGELQIANRDKEAGTLYDMFHTRATLHRRAYQHKTHDLVEIMLTEALVKADDYVKFSGCHGKMFKMSEAIEDMVAYSKLTDRVIEDIYHSDRPELAGAREIIRKVYRRDLYKCVGQTKPVQNQPFFKKSDVPSMLKEICQVLKGTDKPLSTDNLLVTIVNFDYGMKDKNPIDHVRFYAKSNPTLAIQVRKDQVSQMLPEAFHDQHIRVYSRRTDSESLRLATRCFNQWCKNKGLAPPKGGDAFAVDMTPTKNQASADAAAVAAAAAGGASAHSSMYH